MQSGSTHMGLFPQHHGEEDQHGRRTIGKGGHPKTEIMKIQLNKAQGFVLMSVLVLGGIVGLTLASYLVWASNHSTIMRRSNSWNTALPVLEAGLEEALSQLKYNPQ